MTKKQKSVLFKIIASAVFFALGVVFEYWLKVKFYPLPYLASFVTVGYSVIEKAVKNISHGQIFDENFLMLLASIGAIALKDYSESAVIMMFYQVGELFESTAVDKSRNCVKELVSLMPEYANLLSFGEIKQVSPEEVSPGDEIIVKTGEKVPLDGVIVSGSALADTSSLTGESLPKELNTGDEILSGFINTGETVTVRVTKEFENSTVSKIMYLIEEATDNKSKAEGFISRFAKYYTPVVVICSVIVAAVPSLITHNFALWLHRSLLFLVVSCPCALVISVPLCFFCGIGKLGRQGILVKGSNYLEQLSRIDTAAFDKTGTLTNGKFEIQQVCPFGTSGETLLMYAAYAESFSNHPIGVCIKESLKEKADISRFSQCEDLSGYGVRCVFDGRELLAGKRELLTQKGITAPKSDTMLTSVYVSYDGKCLGYLTVADKPKKESTKAVQMLKKQGIAQTVMLTGDKQSIGEYIGKKIGIDKVFGELLPQEKAEMVDTMKNEGKTVMFTGDGLNDAIVLAKADVGIAMGAMGSDAAIESADIVIMDDDIGKLNRAVALSRKTMRIVKENIVFALLVKFSVLIFGTIGLADMWLAVFADVGVSVIAILNCLRVQK